MPVTYPLINMTKTTIAAEKIKIEAKEVSIALKEKAEKVGDALKDKAVDVGTTLRGTAKAVAKKKRDEHIISFLITFLWLYIGVSSGALDLLLAELRAGEIKLPTILAALMVLGRNVLKVIPELASLYFLKLLNYLRTRVQTNDK